MKLHARESQKHVDRVHSLFFVKGLGKLNAVVDVGYLYLSQRLLLMTLDQTAKLTGMFNFHTFFFLVMLLFISI